LSNFPLALRHHARVGKERLNLGRQLEAHREHAVQDVRPDARRLEGADDLAVRAGALRLESEDLLHRDRLAFHAGHLGDAGDLAGAVTQAAQLAEDVDRAGDLLPNGFDRELDARHQHQGFETRKGVARAVRVDCGHRAVVAGVHGLQHVERFAGAALTHDDPLGPHAQGVDDETLDRDLALAVDVLGARLQPADVLLVELELGGVLDRDDPVIRRDEAREDVQERRLAGARTTRDDDVRLGHHAGLHEAEAALGAAAEPDQVLDLERVLGELADRQQRAIDRQRADDGVDSGAVGEPGVGEGYALVDPAADRANYELDHVEELVFTFELDAGQNDLAVHLHVDVVDAVDHDLGDAIVLDDRLDRPELGVVLLEIDTWDADCH